MSKQPNQNQTNSTLIRWIGLAVAGIIILLVGIRWISNRSAPEATPTATLVAVATSPLPTPLQPTPTLVPTSTPSSSTSPIPSPDETAESIPTFTYKIVNIFPHKDEAFTQGLVFTDNILYEGTGLRGQSSLRKVDLQTGEILQIQRIPEQYFGEGITIFGDRLIQLTWQSKVGFVYDKETFELITQFSYPTEGWGLTHSGKQLIMSDGSANLYFLDPKTFSEVGRVTVQAGGRPINRLNELEYINGEVWANIWKTEQLARINPETGAVTGWVNLTGLLTAEDRAQRVDVLNGIAYDAAQERIFVTGKWWPKLFEIELVAVEPQSS